LHAPEARHDVLQRVVERVPHVQHARHVGRRDRDGERAAPIRADAREPGGRGAKPPLAFQAA
jgi:hypothetical protein